jgi:putative Mg2+ transporter-C (MgtC) family protein
VLALALSTVIGAEREIRQKSAGLRTYALVGTGSCLFMLVSEYGFQGGGFGASVTLDPSRVAAQIVSGIGFIGGGLIFVHRKSVRGLTTAAGVWVTAAVGMAAGGNLPLLATVTTAFYLVVSYGYPLITDRLPASRRSPSEVLMTYRDGEGILRRLLEKCAEHGFAVSDLHVERTARETGDGSRAVTVRIELRGGGSIPELAADLYAIDGVLDVSAGDVEELQEA